MGMLSGGKLLMISSCLQEAEVVKVSMFSIASLTAVLSGFHRFRLKGRVYPTILPDGTGEVTVKLSLENPSVVELIAKAGNMA